jgi:hypothetical protein
MQNKFKNKQMLEHTEERRHRAESDHKDRNMQAKNKNASPVVMTTPQGMVQTFCAWDGKN